MDTAQWSRRVSHSCAKRIARNRAVTQRYSTAAAADDTDVDAEIARNLWKHHRMLPPNSSFKHYWDILILLFVLYYALLIPLQLAYELRTSVGLEIFIDFLFMFDIMVNFRTTFYDEDNQIVLDARVVARRYLRSWFGVDLVASMPYNLIFFCVELSATSIAFNQDIFGVFKMPRLVRLTRLWSKVEQLSSAGLLRVLLHITFFILGAHWVGCFWWMIGSASYYDDDTHATTWLKRVPPGSTALSEDAGVTPLAQQWLSSFYWSLTTLMKSPWVGPDTLGEKAYASVIVMMGACVFAILLGNVTAWVATHDKTHAELRDRMTRLHDFSTFRRVPPQLQRQMYSYVGAYWTMTSGLDHKEIMKSLPERLRGDVIASIHAPLIQSCAMLRGCSLECTKALLLKCRPQARARPSARRQETRPSAYGLCPCRVGEEEKG